MNDLAHFHFLRPWWLLLLIPALALWWRRAKTSGLSPWQSVVDEHLQPFVLVSSKTTAPGFLDLIALPLFMALLAFSLAGPTFKKIEGESELLKKPLIILLEMSDHMLSTDISPSRLKRAVFKLRDLLHKERGREVSLIAFAGDAHVVVPLTEDHATLVNLLESLSPELMPVPGANLLSALKEARATLPSGISADILAITSSNLSDEVSAIDSYAKEEHLRPFIWAFATSAGAPLIKKDGQFAREAGGITLSTLKRSWLDQIANKGAAKVFEFTPDDKDVRAISSYMAKEEQIRKGEKKESYDSWYDVGPYVLALAMLVFLVAVMRRDGGFWLLALFIAMPNPKAEASIISRLFMRDDQRAHEALLNNDPKEAASLYKDNFSKGTALYKAKNFKEAARHLAQVKTPDGYYNLGNSLAHLGKSDEAIKAYDEALKLDKDHADARHNKELLEGLKKEQEPPKDENKEQPEQQQKDQEKESNQEDQKGQDKKEQENKEEEPKAKPNKDQGKPKDQQDQSEEANKEEPKPSKPEQQKSDPPQGSEEKPSNKEQEALQQEQKKPPNPEVLHPLRHLDERRNNLFLKRKFLYESRTKKGKQE